MSNELAVPAGGGRATAGGAEIVVASDPIVSQATETALGVAEIATQTEMNTGTDDLRFVTPKKFNDTAASETKAGTLQIATQAEVNDLEPTVDDKAITPQKLALRTASTSLDGIIRIASQTDVDNGTNNTLAVTPLTLETKLAAQAPLLSTFTGTSTITGLTVGKTYLVSVYGVIRNAGNDTATLGAVRVGDGATVGGGTQLATTGTQSINWPDGQAPQSATLLVTAATDTINGAVDWRSAGSRQLPRYMCAVQLD